MKLPKGLITIIGIALLVTTLGCSSPTPAEVAPTPTPAEVAPTPTIEATVEARAKELVAAPVAAPMAPAAPAAAGGFEVDASDFLKEFDDNAVGATGKYKGKEVTVTGTVETIDFDFMDNPYIAVTGGGMFELIAVWCMINDASQSAGLSSGDNVTVVGTFKEWNVFIGTLGNCSVK